MGPFPGVKRPGRVADHPPPSKRRGHVRVGLYLYSTSGPQWSVIGRNFTFTLVYLPQQDGGTVWLAIKYNLGFLRRILLVCDSYLNSIHFPRRLLFDAAVILIRVYSSMHTDNVIKASATDFPWTGCNMFCSVITVFVFIFERSNRELNIFFTL